MDLWQDGYAHVSGLNLVMCIISAAAAFAILALMLQTTPHASFHAFLRGDEQTKWAMGRRMIYMVVIVALMGQSMFILDGKITMNYYSAAIWLAILFSWLVFLSLRAAGVIDQDRWVGFRSGR